MKFDELVQACKDGHLDVVRTESRTLSRRGNEETSLREIFADPDSYFKRVVKVEVTVPDYMETDVMEIKFKNGLILESDKLVIQDGVLYFISNGNFTQMPFENIKSFENVYDDMGIAKILIGV